LRYTAPVSSQLSAISYQLSAISYQLSAVSCQKRELNGLWSRGRLGRASVTLASWLAIALAACALSAVLPAVSAARMTIRETLAYI
jgi:hypothetical protein